jgi:aryl-alcohol dehydrogenase-like predicted oxidoreductase
MAEKIKIHNTDLEVSRINFGGNVFGWTLDEKQSFEILDALVEKTSILLIQQILILGG